MSSLEEIRTSKVEKSTAASPDDVNVTAHYCSPERTVFTEEDNTDGWIASDLTVELSR